MVNNCCLDIEITKADIFDIRCNLYNFSGKEIFIKIPKIMKSFLRPFSLLVLFFTFSLNGFSQNCEFYFPLVENRGVQLQNFNPRDRLQSSQEIRVQRVETTGEKVTATMESRVFDQRGREQHQGSFQVSCTGNQMMIDVQSMLDPNLMEGFQGMEVQVEGSEIILPSGLAAGQSLPDAEMNMKVVTGGLTFADIHFTISNRKVESRESVEVPAGTFECYKLSYETFMETRTMGIPIRVSGRVIEYHAPGIGAVRTETYDSRDRLQGYTVLSKIFE
jgi:hypothetical protein